MRRRLQSTAASLHEERGEIEPALALYRTVLRTRRTWSRRAPVVARILEKQGKAADARALWDEIVAAPPGKQGWLEAHYQSARLSVALGDQARACTVLRKVPDRHARQRQRRHAEEDPGDAARLSVVST